MNERDKYYLLFIVLLVICFSAIGYSLGAKESQKNASSDLKEINPVPDYINLANSGRGISPVQPAQPTKKNSSSNSTKK